MLHIFELFIIPMSKWGFHVSSEVEWWSLCAAGRDNACFITDIVKCIEWLLVLLMVIFLNWSTRCHCGWSTMVQAESRGFETLWNNWNLSDYLALPTTLDTVFTQPLTEVNTRERNKEIFLWIRARPVHEADNLMLTDCLESVGSSPSQNLTGLRGLLRR
jgi:hypothetical protein